MLVAAALDVRGNAARAGTPSVVTVPLRLSSNYPLIDIEVAGIRLTVLFDLGEDSALVLTGAALAKLHVKATGPGYKVSDPKGNTLESKTFRIARLNIGGASFTNVPGRLDVHDPSYDSSKVGQEGYIGPALLRDYRIVLDYLRGKLTLIPSARTDSEAFGCVGVEVPFVPEWHGMPVTKSITDLGELTFIWDTGNPSAFIKESLLRAQGKRVADGQFHSRQFRLNGVEFGPLALEPFAFEQPPGVDGFIGTAFFARHAVCVDLPGRRFFISH